MTGPALAYHYRYPFASQVVAAQRPQLQLATFTDEESSPYFFTGSLHQPHLVAKAMLALVRVVRSRFFLPLGSLAPGLADPIITSHGDFLRFEVFSQCCSIYARLDLPESALRGETTGRGTTNVDFNPALVAALARIRQNDDLQFQVGADEFVLLTEHQQCSERKVQLPLRWLKGLTAVTTYAARLQPFCTLSPAELVRFLRALPSAAVAKGLWWLQPQRNTVRLSQRQTKEALQLGGPHRLKLLEELAFQAKQLTIYGDAEIDATGWVLDLGHSRFSLLMTHDVWRGFSGEGQALRQLATAPSTQLLSNATAQLHWQSRLTRSAFEQADMPSSAVDHVLYFLATQGKVGYDLHAADYYHRQLPFAIEQVVKLQPRLRSATKLLESNAIAESPSASEHGERCFHVDSQQALHIVRMSEEQFRCTCPWYAKHGDRRGPCKHVLAVQMSLDRHNHHCE